MSDEPKAKSDEVLDILDYYEAQIKRRESKPKLGEFRITEEGQLEVCNKIFNGVRYWQAVGATPWDEQK